MTRVLLGLHDSSFRSIVEMRLEIVLGYQFDSPGPDQLLDYLRQGVYDGVFMDLNYGRSGSADISPSIEAYNARGEAQFLGISGLDDALAAAREVRIPCVGKTPKDVKKMYDFLDSLGS